MMTVTIPASGSRPETQITTDRLRALFSAGNDRGDGFAPSDVPGCCATEIYDDSRSDGVSVYLPPRKRCRHAPSPAPCGLTSGPA